MPNPTTPPGQIDLPGVETRSAGLRWQIRLLIFGGVILVSALFAMFHPSDKPLDPNASILRPGPGGGLILSNHGLVLPLPSGWTLSKKTKLDEVRAGNADDTCRVLVIRSSVGDQPETFQQGMAQKMRDDGNRVTILPPAELSGRHALRMQAALPSGSAEDIYTVPAGSSLYTLILVNTAECKEILQPIAQGFEVTPEKQ